VRAQTGEEKVTIDAVPPAVRAAILAQVSEGKLVDIGVYRQDGRTVYEIEMVVGGSEYDVLFSEDGKTLRKTAQGGGAAAKPSAADLDPGFQHDFALADRQLTTTGRSRYFVLEPGYQLVLEGDDGGRRVNLTITVLDQTEQVGGFATRVVEERETVDDQLVEVSRNFFAMCSETKSVFYFGEDVDMYEDGKVVGHEGAWRHGKDGARAGLMMPGEPVLGAAYYQEVAPGAAMDRARVAATDVTLATPAGTFARCLRIEEENPLDGEKEFKVHAPGIGLVQDEQLRLVKHGFVKTIR
jgi:hypothetical protein